MHLRSKLPMVTSLNWVLDVAFDGGCMMWSFRSSQSVGRAFSARNLLPMLVRLLPKYHGARLGPGT